MGTSSSNPFYVNLPKSNHGFSLVEVLSAIGILSFLVLAVSSIIVSLAKSQSESQIKSSLNLQQERIRSLLLNDSAWDLTLGGPAATPLNTGLARLSCIPNRTQCNHTNKPVPAGDPTNAYYMDPAFIAMTALTEADGELFIDNSSASNGFTYDGRTCTTFNPAGNDQCPFRWHLRVAFSCPDSTATCIEPAVEVYALLDYRPTPATQIALNLERLRVSVVRGARGVNRTDRVSAYFGGSGSGTGGGACATGSWSDVPLTLEVNQNGNASGSGSLTFAAGTYSCSFFVSCFECGAIQARLVYPGGSSLAPGALANIGILAKSSVDNVSFNLVSPGTVTLQYQAQSNPVAPTNPNFCRGMALSDYASLTKFAQIDCLRIR